MMGRIMRKFLRQQAGIGLPELMVAVAVIGLIMAGVFGVLSTSVKSFQHTADQGANVQLARNSLNEISNELRNANSVTIINAASVTYQSPLDVAPVNNPNRSIALNSNSIIITYRDSSNTVTAVKTLGQGRIASLQISRDATNSRVFTINISLQSNAYSGAVSSPVSTVVTTLN